LIVIIANIFVQNFILWKMVQHLLRKNCGFFWDAMLRCIIWQYQ